VGCESFDKRTRGGGWGDILSFVYTLQSGQYNLGGYYEIKTVLYAIVLATTHPVRALGQNYVFPAPIAAFFAPNRGILPVTGPPG
jgi:hypothetical protein